MRIAVRKLVILFFLTAISSCGVRNSFVTNHENGWFEDESHGLVYCKANNLKSGAADPICFEAAIKIYDK